MGLSVCAENNQKSLQTYHNLLVVSAEGQLYIYVDRIFSDS